MPTKRLPKLRADSRRTETKENISGASLTGKVGGGRMTRKRSLSDPGDASNADMAVLRMSQEANSSSSMLITDLKDGNESSGRHVNSARLFAQSLQKMSARKPGKGKRMKISSGDCPLADAPSSEDGKVVAASSSACEMFARTCSTSPVAKESTVKMSLPQKSASRLSLKSRKSEQPLTNSALDHEMSSRIAEGDDRVSDENKCETLTVGHDPHTTSAVEELEPLKTPVVAPALKNLGNTCFLNSVLQVLYYTPTFVDNVNVLYEEMRATINDNCSVRTLAHCELKLLPQHCSFIVRLNQLFGYMRTAEQAFLNGSEPEAISPINLLVCLEKTSSLFYDREQQDGHECLRCILLYIQEATRAVNQQRAVHRDLTRPNRSNDVDRILQIDVANSAAEAVGVIDESGSPLDRISPATSPCSTVRRSQPNQPDAVKSISPTAAASTGTKVSTMTPKHDCLVNSSPCGGSSSQNPTLRESKPHTADSAKSTPSGTTSSAAGSKKTPTAGKITSYFASAPPAPKSVSDITVNASRVPDFVEAMCEGKSERRTRCLECESITRCTETFQDVEVVAQKAMCRARASSPDASDSDRDDGVKEKCWIVSSLEEVELLGGDNKYLCSECLHHTEADRSVTYQQLPHILTIHIKRFAGGFFRGSYTKFMACVNIPFVLPCLEANCKAAATKSKHTKHWYELYAVICHSGTSLSSGHYISYVRAPPANAAMASLEVGDGTDGSDTEPVWFICNDDVVTALKETDLKRKLSVVGATTPYMLFYRRISA